ncbi:nucleotidyltransferase [uncultured Succiniclasticum sp.]|uniref:nucleotidyltransferase domain-containing protein n=1 Tax=uncultured Succiniclasticum sp. TaxID=1500547 RepID=UPI0025F3F32A|nr:nucleotidyltransferase [uncultured Succiniclasticum sp.]
MKYSEETLQAWTAPLSSSEEQRAENTIKMILSAIDNSDELKTKDIEVFIQGSFANNTNVRAESDVDVCVMLKDTFHFDLPDGKTRQDYGFTPASITFFDYRDMVKRALQQKFKTEYVSDGNKSLKIDENTYHVKADVVPAFQLRNYYYWKSTDPNRYIEGTWFMSKNGKEIKNYPKEHIRNGITKNNDTNYEYKKLVRIMKHIKNEMVDDKKTNGDIITSFLVECLVWNIPNSIITGYNTWTETIKQAIIYLYNAIKEGKHEKWTEVSRMLYLFKGRKWTDSDVRQWLYDAWNYLGYDQ